MKAIIDVLEKLRVDDIVIEEFPIDGTVEEMAKFLEEKRFVAANESDIYNKTVNKIFDSAKSKCYTTYKNEHLWFADTSKGEISKRNPIFQISIPLGMFSVYYYDSGYMVVDIVKNDKKAFLKELNKRFGWQ